MGKEKCLLDVRGCGEGDQKMSVGWPMAAFVLSAGLLSYAAFIESDILMGITLGTTAFLFYFIWRHGGKKK